MDSLMIEQETRLARAELRLELHDKLHNDTQSSIKVLTDGISKLVQAEIRREQDEETFKRLFTEIGALRRELQLYKDVQTEKELTAYKGIVWRVVGLCALVTASVIAGHFGGKWLG